MFEFYHWTKQSRNTASHIIRFSFPMGKHIILLDSGIASERL